MFQNIHPQHCDSNGALDFGELLRWADLATCAAAEAHTRANCVTVAVSDLALEPGVTPANGDVLEITATLVLAGNTSLDVALLVTVEPRNSSMRVAACSAQFTYVTMKLPDGTRPRCPPLALHSDEEKHMAHIAKERKTIISKQRALSTTGSYRRCSTGSYMALHGSVPMSRTTTHMTELVLPPHTNHMNNTFGGQVMAWMHKAATIAARRHVTQAAGARPQAAAASLRTVAVEAVEFPAPSRASDHLLFEATVARVFAPNHLAVTVKVQKRVISEGGGNTMINTGVFHLDAVEAQADGAGPCKALNVADVRPETDEEIVVFQEMGLRRELTAARALLLSFRGGALPWVEALAAEAGRTTVQAVLRMLPSSEDGGGGAVAWQPMDVAGARPGLQVYEALNLWGQDQTATKFVLSCADVPASAAFEFLMDASRRREFDELCVEYEKEASLGEEAELMRLVLRVPLEAARGCQLAGLARVLSACVPEPTREFSLLRAWRREDSGNGVFASRSVAHPGASGSDLKRRQVVQPSGWVVTAAGGGCVLTYVVTFENENIRQLLGAVDNVAPLAAIHCRSMERLHALLTASV